MLPSINKSQRSKEEFFCFNYWPFLCFSIYFLFVSFFMFPSVVFALGSQLDIIHLNLWLRFLATCEADELLLILVCLHLSKGWKLLLSFSYFIHQLKPGRIIPSHSKFVHQICFFLPSFFIFFVHMAGKNSLKSSNIIWYHCKFIPCW